MSQTVQARVVKYLGEARCDLCDLVLDREGDVMYDARMRVGTWAKMCRCCFDVHGAGALGTGHGQRYVRKNGEMVKVQG